ncbi:hypothetical protein BC936DRAFT_148815 [Jimgerdemannia flammicorona]|uniref:Uncharacterized protein n=1 Tax=Jimgerdemannia flammicorona TaxID=994334 RepID=A0A433D2F4_9FUNG|nr:hypothetical protein BC936DRAFT_148815 [Jimgerdemannia flammicorona]
MSSFCLVGHIFSMDLVKSVLPTYINAFECLRISMGEGIIVRSDYNDFDAQFYHDRVQTCAYLMLPDDDRIRLHHAIGMKSLETMESAEWLSFDIPMSFVETDDRQVLFDVVYQLNKAVSLIKENGDTGLLRRLNFEAGCKAQVSYSVDKALEYFRIAENLLPEQAWDIDSIREEVFRLKLRIADCMRIVDDNANALLYATEALSHAKDQLEKSSVVVLCIQILHNGGKYTEAYEIANRFISDFMETIPLDATVEDANEAVREAATQLGRISIENIKRLLFSKDPYHIAIMNVLNVAATTAFFKSDAIFGLYTAAMVKRSLTHGLVPSSLVGFGYLAMYYSTLANNSESTFLIAETAYELSGTLDNLSRAKVLMAYALCSAERTCTPAPEFKELMQEAFELATRAHDPMVAGIAGTIRSLIINCQPSYHYECTNFFSACYRISNVMYARTGVPTFSSKARTSI